MALMAVGLDLRPVRAEAGAPPSAALSTATEATGPSAIAPLPVSSRPPKFVKVPAKVVALERPLAAITAPLANLALAPIAAPEALATETPVPTTEDTALDQTVSDQTASALIELAQTTPELQTEPAGASSDPLVPETDPAVRSSDRLTTGVVGQPEVYLQGAALLQGDDLSARLRVGGIYTFSPSVFAGAVVDLTAGNSFADSPQTGLSVNELYVTASPANLPELRFTVGLMDLTSYFDRNSFAKDAVTHFFNPVFQTNPALSAANISSRPGVLVNWTPLDELSLTATAFSSSRDLGSFTLDAFAGEVGVRFGNAIVRGTYATGRDAGFGTGFEEVFAVPRQGGSGLGPQPGDRESAFGLNAEYFIPELKLGLFGRYGWYNNLDLGEGGNTFSFGVNALDVFLPQDRLGLAYGRQLSNASLQQISGQPQPDVLELFYDVRLTPNLRAGASVQQRNAFSETYLGLRVRYDLSWQEIRRTFE
ncbi:porin [Pseudanabaena sp. FACHB-2040]|uniref:porin n=1 Tax=Pseudanabaena sp. FACHB-2040 TaxID=2692859 RepID=UPI001686DC68|nr:porin [Pseudanabaena sp. FACHB-2040]MBD2258028.1 porin [Pseudanabaena sp. FACHB-2040]